MWITRMESFSSFQFRNLSYFRYSNVTVKLSVVKESLKYFAEIWYDDCARCLRRLIFKFSLRSVISVWLASRNWTPASTWRRKLLLSTTGLRKFSWVPGITRRPWTSGPSAAYSESCSAGASSSRRRIPFSSLNWLPIFWERPPWRTCVTPAKGPRPTCWGGPPNHRLWRLSTPCHRKRPMTSSTSCAKC